MITHQLWFSLSQTELTDRESQFEAERQQLSAALHSQQREYQQQQC